MKKVGLIIRTVYPVVSPTKLKAEKFIGYTSYGYGDVIATINEKNKDL
ncbi:MAG: hypothetical protein K2G36_07900 [Ruminococcus sp.]|nr:hypothetical protein [Ruminococcus sp.]